MKFKYTSPLYYTVVVCWLLYLPFFVNRKWLHFNLPAALDNYFTDVLCIPLVLGSTLVVLQKLKKDSNLILTALQIVTTVVYFSIVFEWLLPEYNAIYTGDDLDVVCYAVGGIAFYLIQMLHISKLRSV
ncbi:MAG: hypothetical protein ACI8Q1_000024 [Parvicella sp.]|jgi:hypothetical protein